MADPPMAKSKITDFFQQYTAEANDGVVELVRRADPGGSKLELQDRELFIINYYYCFLLVTICDHMLRRMWGQTSCDHCDVTLIT